MSQSKAKKAKLNVIVTFVNQVATLLLGLLIPRLVLTSYGSEVNGLITSVNQIFIYVGLLEAGIGSASLYALYKPFANDDKYEICDVYSATKKYFRKVTVVYSVCVVLIAFIYPLFIDSSLSYTTTMLVILLQGIANVIVFAFSTSCKQVMLADGRNYIVSFIGIAIYIISSVAKIILMNLGYDVVMLQVSHVIINGITACVYNIVAHRLYPWLKTHKSPKMEALSQRNAFVVHEASGVVFNSTDAFVLSTFCNLMIASVYTIYNLVFRSLYVVIESVMSGLYYILGQSYANGDKKNYTMLYDAYESIYMYVSFVLFSVTYVLIVPFVKLYTAGVSDIKYVDYFLPILFAMVQLMSATRMVACRMVMIAGYAKNTQNRGIIESIIKIVFSIILVQFYGIYGVLMSTIFALAYRCNDAIIYTNMKILQRQPWKTYLKVVVNFFAFVLIVAAEYVFRAQLTKFCNGFISFLLLGFVFTIMSAILFLIVIILTDKNAISMMKTFMPGIIKRKQVKAEDKRHSAC